MNTVKRIECKNCKAHILGDRLFCSVCLAPRPKGLLSVEGVLLAFIALGASAIVYWAI